MLEAGRSWRVVPYTGVGKISNVSAFVMPAGTGVGNDGQQPMLPDWDKLLEIERIRLERARLKLARELARRERKRKRPSELAATKPPTPRQKRPYRPQERVLRNYDSCKKQFIAWEDALHELDLRVTPEAIFTAAAGPHPKTQEKIIGRFGMHYPEHWPPRSWPAQPPVDPGRQN
jgi:hypothetical protein